MLDRRGFLIAGVGITATGFMHAANAGSAGQPATMAV